MFVVAEPHGMEKSRFISTCTTWVCGFGLAASSWFALPGAAEPSSLPHVDLPFAQQFGEGDAFSVFDVVHVRPVGSTFYATIRSSTKVLPHKGLVLKVFRQTRQRQWVETGVLRVLERQDFRGQQAWLTEVQSEGYGLAKLYWPKFKGIMAGDVAVRPKQHIKQVRLAQEALSFRFDQLFVDASPSPRSQALSMQGQTLLRERLANMLGRRIHRMLIKGHADTQGSRRENQIESLARAQTVRQFIIEALGVSPKRIVAVGKGELEPLETSFLAQQQLRNRRVEIVFMSPKSSINSRF